MPLHRIRIVLGARLYLICQDEIPRVKMCFKTLDGGMRVYKSPHDYQTMLDCADSRRAHLAAAGILKQDVDTETGELEKLRAEVGSLRNGLEEIGPVITVDREGEQGGDDAHPSVGKHGVNAGEASYYWGFHENFSAVASHGIEAHEQAENSCAMPVDRYKHVWEQGERDGGSGVGLSLGNEPIRTVIV